MLSVLKQGKDAQSRDYVEIGLNALLFQGMAVVLPIGPTAMIYLQAGQTGQALPWFMWAAPLLGGLAALAAVTWLCARSALRVTIDRAAGKLVVRAGNSESEFRMAEIERAEFVVEQGAKGPVNRLVFHMRAGGSVPGTPYPFGGYLDAHKNAMIAAINAALGQRMV